MVSKFAILCNLCLLASAVLALPSSSHDAHLARDHENDLSELDSRGIIYSGNWAGAGWSVAAGTFTSVKADFVVPTVVSSDSATSAAVWVGIDGYSCPSALFQTGVMAGVDGNGHPTYYAFYEWFPAASSPFSQPITISAGDHITAGIVVNSPTSAQAIIENWTTNKIATQTVTSTFALCQQDAEWVVENINKNIPFPFGPTTFANAVGGTSGNTQYTSSGANIYDITGNTNVLTAVTVNPDTSITVTHA